MNSSNDLKERLAFIIVDNSYKKTSRIKGVVRELGADPSVVSRGLYCRRTLFAAIEAYENGKIPVIFLEESFAKKEVESGTLISIALREYLKGKGGLIFPTSESRELQLSKLSNVFKEEDSDWYIEKDLNPLSEDFNSREISRVCNEFLSYVDNKEERSERKHG